MGASDLDSQRTKQIVDALVEGAPYFPQAAADNFSRQAREALQPVELPAFEANEYGTIINPQALFEDMERNPGNWETVFTFGNQGDRASLLSGRELEIGTYTKIRHKPTGTIFYYVHSTGELIHHQQKTVADQGKQDQHGLR